MSFGNPFNSFYAKLFKAAITEEDYANKRKAKFLLFTCLVSAIINFVGTVLALKTNDFTSALLLFPWFIVLTILLLLTREGKLDLARYLFFSLWLIYSSISVRLPLTAGYDEYYFVLSILLSFILFDSFVFSIVSVLCHYFLLFGATVNPDQVNKIIRFGSLFACAAYLKHLILEVEDRLNKEREKKVAFEREQARIKNELLSAEINYRNQEITNFAVQLTQKNQFIESLRDKLNVFQKDPNSSSSLLKELRALITAYETISADRNLFEQRVQEIHEGFYGRLLAQFPEVSGSEKRLAGLLRLELSSKEIATILNISPKSVDMSRYRLRKKMALVQEDNLVEELARI